MSGQAWAWPPPKSYTQLLPFMDVCQHAKYQNESSSPSRDISDQRFLHSHWLINFGPILGQMGQNRIFSKKSLHHLKSVMLFYVYAKNYKKQSNGSKDIAIWRIELSDWSRGQMPISREPEFSQTCNIFCFKPFLATSNDSILHKSRKP